MRFRIRAYFSSVFLIMCHPNSVLIMPSSPFFKLNAVFSKALTILPRPNHPRSPPFFLLGHWDSVSAIFSKGCPV